MVRNILFTSVLSLTFIALQAQDLPVHPTEIITGTYHGLSRPLRDIPAMQASEFQRLEQDGLKRTLNKGLKYRTYPYAATALPRGNDPVWQDFMGATTGNRSPVVNFIGQTSPYYPPDCNGTAGPNHFMQTINCIYAIYDKAGNIVAGPTNLNQLFQGVPGATNNDGDPIILYDEQADRWLVTEFSFSGSPDYMLMAVSATNDPTGTWHKYSFQVATMPDYPKFSVWRDGYYMGDNNGSGNDTYVFEREKMLTGATAQAVGFNNPWRPSSVDGFMCVPPIDNDGTLAPTGTPGMYIAFNDDAIGGGSDQLWLYELTVNWTTPSSSALIRSQQINVEPFNCNFGNNWDNIDQKGTGQRLDGIPQVIMNVPQYRNFGSYQTIVCCHTVNVNGIRHAGIRWYELRKTTGNWEVRQQGTYAPDAHSRWMGSIMLNGSNQIGLGYSISSTTINPGIFYCGQSAAEYANASGILDIAEDTIQVGTNSQTGYNRWGDYAQTSVDPTDDKTFWFTSEYIGSGGSRKTKIASFRFISAPVVSTMEASNVTATTATLNGMVNPGGLEAEYHFAYGLLPYALNDVTPAVQAGSGSTPMVVSADVTGLLSDTIYYFRIVAQNSAGTTNGAVVQFYTPEAPYMTVTPGNQNVPVLQGSTEFIVASNTSWTVESSASWCTVTPSGSNNDTIEAVYSENTFAAPRTAVITITGSGVGAQTVTVSQEGAAPYMSVTPPVQNVPALQGNTEFQVASNTTWTVESNAAWCTVTSPGSGSDTITAVYDENPYAAMRTAVITVTGAGVGAQTVTVSQEGAAPFLTVAPPGQEVNSSSGNVQFDVASNTSWTVSKDVSWCTVTPAGTYNGAIVAEYQENTSVNPRACIIVASAIGVASDTVVLAQAGALPTLSVTPLNQNVSSVAGSTAFTVASNTGWTVTGNAGWCTLTQSGTGNGTIVADYTQNTSDQQRTASIEVKVTGLAVQTVTVTQAKSSIGLEENASGAVRIYPNPTHGIFRIVPAAGNSQSMEVTVQDLGGKVILKKLCKGAREYLIDLATAPHGTYHVIVKTETSLAVTKLVVIR